MTKRLCGRCGRYYPYTLKTCPNCRVVGWRRPVRVSASGSLMVVTALWTLYCIVQGVLVWRSAPDLLRSRLGQAADDPELFGVALDTFQGAFLQVRLSWWFAISVVLLLIALILKKTAPAPPSA